MDKQQVNNGFTLIEMMLVLLIVCCLNFGLYQNVNNDLMIFLKQFKYASISAQELAYFKQKRIDVNCIDDTISFGEETLRIPEGIRCDAFEYFYNAKGNISKAHTVKCTDGIQDIKLIFQLGSGRVRIEQD